MFSSDEYKEITYVIHGSEFHVCNLVVRYVDEGVGSQEYINGEEIHISNTYGSYMVYGMCDKKKVLLYAVVHNKKRNIHKLVYRELFVAYLFNVMKDCGHTDDESVRSYVDEHHTDKSFHERMNSTLLVNSNAYKSEGIVYYILNEWNELKQYIDSARLLFHTYGGDEFTAIYSNVAESPLEKIKEWGVRETNELSGYWVNEIGPNVKNKWSAADILLIRDECVCKYVEGVGECSYNSKDIRKDIIGVSLKKTNTEHLGGCGMFISYKKWRDFVS